MTRHFWSMATLALCVVVVQSAPLLAQPVPPSVPQRPTFSPYLNLLRGGNPGLNYYGLVRPQQQFQQQVGQLQAQLGGGLGGLGGNIGGDFAGISTLSTINPFLPVTGNVATFDNLGNYFDRIGGGAAIGLGGLGGGGFGGQLGAARFGMNSGSGTGLGQSGRGPGGGLGGIQPSFARSAKTGPRPGAAPGMNR